MTVRAIVFDFGNVIGFFQRKRAALNLAAYGPAGLDPTLILPLLAHPEYEPLYETAGMTSAQIIALLRSELALTGDDDQLAHAFADMFEPNPAVCSLIPRLQGRYHLALLSNTNDMHYRLFRTQFADVLDRFDHLCASHLVRMRKPDPAIYRHVQERAGCAANEVVFIDDLPANIAAARALGWRTVLYTTDVDLPRALADHGVTC